MWLAYFAVLAVAFNVGWSVELWGGVAVMSALTGVGLSVLVVPPPVPMPLPDGVALPDALAGVTVSGLRGSP